MMLQQQGRACGRPARPSRRNCSRRAPLPCHSRCDAATGPAPGAADQQQQQQQQLREPFAEKTLYNDSWLDKLFIRLFTVKIAAQLGPEVRVPGFAETQYDDFVRVSREILKGRTTAQQHALVRRVLLSLMPPGLPAALKALFRPTQWAAEVNAAVASVGFGWLVGECELRSEAVEVEPGRLREQRSVVHIKKCRYLEASGCVGLCVNMCKIPTQSFFTDDVGMPLTMQPNFEDLSCTMTFGQAPPASIGDDPAYAQPCFVPQCALAARVEPCPKTDTERQQRGAQQGGGGGGGGEAAAAAAVVAAAAQAAAGGGGGSC